MNHMCNFGGRSFKLKLIETLLQGENLQLVKTARNTEKVSKTILIFLMIDLIFNQIFKKTVRTKKIWIISVVFVLLKIRFSNLQLL